MNPANPEPTSVSSPAPDRAFGGFVRTAIIGAATLALIASLYQFVHHIGERGRAAREAGDACVTLVRDGLAWTTRWHKLPGMTLAPDFDHLRVDPGSDGNWLCSVPVNRYYGGSKTADGQDAWAVLGQNGLYNFVRADVAGESLANELAQAHMNGKLPHAGDTPR